MEYWSRCAIWSPALTESLCSKEDICLAWCNRLYYTVNLPCIVSACVCFCQCVYVQICAPVYKYVCMNWCISMCVCVCTVCTVCTRVKITSTVKLSSSTSVLFLSSLSFSVIKCYSVALQATSHDLSLQIQRPGEAVCVCVASAWRKPIP